MGRINDWQEVNICLFRELLSGKERSIRRRSDGSCVAYYRDCPADRFPIRVAVVPQGSSSEQISIAGVLDRLWDRRVAEAVSAYYSPRHGLYELSFSVRRMMGFFL